MIDLLEILIECYNGNDFSSLRQFLSPDCKYTSQWVFDEMVGDNKICDYLIAKSKRIAEAGARVIAKRVTITSPYSGQDAALMFQDNEQTPSCIILIKAEKNLIKQIDICMPELFTFTYSKKESVQDFLASSVQILHVLAKAKGFASKGFILHEGLFEIGTQFISEGLKSEPTPGKRPYDFYYSLAASNLQMGLILAHYACVDKQSVISGRIFEKISDAESFYKTLVIVLKDNLNLTYQQWDDFRHFIVPYWDKLIQNYINDPNIEAYNSELLAAYYLLGVSIGLDKYE